ncbi:MAG: (Fe-S)-binding protein [Hyphomicrobiaceae bacterium]|nr:(Fe-S)-binding protein [Hyphomicrobiaceae bacterium]
MTSTDTIAQPTIERPRVGLFVTCLVDVVRPSIGFAAVKLLEASGCDVVVPAGQTCCGQPAYNSGDRADARAIAVQTIEAFDGCDYVVAPSGSCAGMLKSHYPRLFEDEPAAQARAHAFAGRVHELVSFLVDVRGWREIPPELQTGQPMRITYHDSCSGLRELGIKDQPRQLLTSINGLELVEMADSEICCGFGGTFSVKFPDISNAMVEKKTDNIAATEPLLVLAGDLGCLMNMAGKLSRQGRPIAARHVAEVLAGETTTPALLAPTDPARRD